MFIFLLSLTGIPLTAGFTAKFAVILSAVGAGYVLLAVLAVVCTVISAFFYLRVAVLMYMTEPQGSAPGRLSAAVRRRTRGRRGGHDYRWHPSQHAHRVDGAATGALDSTQLQGPDSLRECGVGVT